jgi:hypothetical protein
MQRLEQETRKMIRNMELIREILIKMEQDPMCDGQHEVNLDMPNYPFEELKYHSSLLMDAGFIKGERDSLIPIVSRLTWEGHEFLDNIKDPGIWSKTKERAKGIPGVALKVIAEIAMSEVRKRLGLL